MDKRINKAYVRYDKNGRIIPGGPRMSRFKPKSGGWKEINAYQCCNPTPLPTINALRLTFDSIANADLLVGDALNVSDWNTFFDLPTYGNPFTSVEVVGNEVRLFGGSEIIMTNGGGYGNNLFSNNQNLIEINDLSGCVIELGAGICSYSESLVTINFPNVLIGGNECFYYCTSLINVNLPILQTIDYSFFEGCSSLVSISLPQLITTVNSCFQDCTSLTTINIPQLTTAEAYSFIYCTSLTTVDLPLLTTAGVACFFNCISLTTINLPLCTDLGGTVGNNNVFAAITGNTITLTVPSALMTCNSGNPDGDIQYLQANNTVTVVTV